MTENVPAATGNQAGGGEGDAGNAGLPSTERATGRGMTAAENPELVDRDGGKQSRLNPLVAGFNKLTMMRQFGLLIGLAASIALGLGVVLWSQRDAYHPLMNSTNSYAAADVIEVLQSEDINFDIDPASGVILVRQDDLHRARLAVAGAGLSDDQTVGYELLDDDQPLGTSQFMENARYMRALEGELARTVASMNQVRSARVHLAIPERSVFIRDRRQPSASVFTDLHAGADMDVDSIRAIRNLVATSIPELTPDNVSVVDQRGQLLSAETENPEEELTDRQFQYTNRVEENLLSQINSILSPVVGSDNFRAEVSADIDFTRTEQAEELYNPDLIALRSEQTIDEERIGQNEGGIPGALTNQPPGTAEAPEEAAGEDGEAPPPPQTNRSEATRNYEVDRTLSYTQFQQGRMRRLTVAVVVDDLAATDPETGETVREPWTEEELQNIRLLVQDAVGYDPTRGDSINVVNSGFRGGEGPVEEPAWYTQPWFWEIAKQILAGLFVLVLVFGILRPALRNLLSKGEEEETEEDGLASLDVDDDSIADDKVTLSTTDEYQLPGASENFERQLDALRGLIAEDPGRVALVLRRWIMTND